MILFFDIDGTIIGEKSHKILPSTIEAIRKARENGHITVINTGRTSYLIDKELEDIGFDGFIMACGSQIRYHGKDLLHVKIPRERYKDIMNGLRKYKIDAVLEGPDCNYLDLPERIHAREFDDFTKEFRNTYKRWQDEDIEFLKFFSYVGREGDIEGYQKEFSDLFELIDREHGYFEAVPKGYSKASGIYYLTDYLGIPMEETVAIGDSNNDISMLKAAHLSIAMGNSTKEVLDMADYITTDVDEDGIFNALTWLGVL